MKWSGILALATVLIMPVAFALDTKPFEGKWVLDKKATGKSGAPANLTEQIRRQGDSVVIDSKFDAPKDGVFPIAWLGIMVETLRLNSDGHQTTNQVGPYKHVSKTIVLGNSMVTDWTATDPPGSVKGQWVRTLEDDGKRMRLRVKATSSDGRTFENTVVMKKK